LLERQDMVLRGVPIHNYKMAKDLRDGYGQIPRPRKLVTITGDGQRLLTERREAGAENLAAAIASLPFAGQPWPQAGSLPCRVPRRATVRPAGTTWTSRWYAARSASMTGRQWEA
jgi:hypothetical protein